MRDQLVTAVIDGTGDMPTLSALATAERAELAARTPVINTVREAVLARLIELYSKVARDSYRKVAAQFDAMAANFTTAAGHCDPEADGAAIVGEPDQVRECWLNVAVLGVELDKLTPKLQAAAQLCGLPEAVSRDAGGRDGILLPLVCDPGTLHRRKVWQAFGAKGRCGKWSALVALGCTVRAANLDTFEPYRPPKPLVRKYRPLANPDRLHQYEEYLADPEDNPAQGPAPATPPRRARALAR